MTTLIAPTALVATLTMTSASFGLTDDVQTHTDPRGDSVIRRTDIGNDGPVTLAQNLPDMIAIAVGGWRTSSPRTNPYSGFWIDARDTNLFRIDVVFDGLVNPPGPINLLGDGYDPFRYGPSPVYGYVEIDVDSDRDTGGEIDNVANRPLGNVSRFGGRFEGSSGSDAAVSHHDFDGDLCSPPLVERSGEEFHIALCMCHAFTIDTNGDATPNSFDAGDTWFLTGRLFRRTHAFKDHSFAFGGSEPQMYDPIVTLRFDHDAGVDRTSVSIIWALTNSGSAALRGESTQANDFNVANQTSILEAISGMRTEAMNGSGGQCDSFDLLRDWGDGNHDELDDFLRADHWDVRALFGTAYDVEQPDATYVWTDVGPEFAFGDCNGDRFVNETDVSFVTTAIASADGSSFDDDGIQNGQVSFAGAAKAFALYDLNYDGRINVGDVELLRVVRRGDLNGDGHVDVVDRGLLVNMIGLTSTDLGYNSSGDLDRNGRIDVEDDRRLRRIMRLSSSMP